jgi:hypothetical protein
MSHAIATVFSALSSSDHSHNSGLARIVSRMMSDHRMKHDILWTGGEQAEWNKFDRIYLNGKLSLNVFGGVTDPNVTKLKRLANFKGEIVPVWYPMPDYAAFAWNPRWRDSFTKDEHVRLNNLVANSLVPFRNPCKTGKLVVGDSHAPSVWRPGYNLEVLSGCTMHNIATTDTLDQLITDDVNELTIYFGNIDVRHHVCRQPNPRVAALTLVDKFITKVRQLRERHNIGRVELVQLLPIECESREIPGPGHYKGKPFHGSHAERDDLRQLINEQLENYVNRRKSAGWSFYTHPCEWALGDGKLDQQFMEKPRSVHIAPKFYRAFR